MGVRFAKCGDPPCKVAIALLSRRFEQNTEVDRRFLGRRCMPTSTGPKGEDW
jgi:hypothetical protein